MAPSVALVIANAALVVAGATSSPFKSVEQTAILIRHGEKPSTGDDLSPRGYQRAACLINHFRSANITHLFAYTDHNTRRPVETITPLAASLNTSIDTSIGRDDVDKLVAKIASLPAHAVALVCWEHKVLHDIAKALGVDYAPDYDKDEFDLQWTVRSGKLDSAHEHC